jgi:plasmid stabilization system protein ParE
VPEIRFSIEADEDVERIWTDLLAYSERAAGRLTQELDDAASSLLLFPERGVRRQDLGPQLRMLIVRRYLIIYRYDQPLDEIRIIRILEGERDLTDLF